MKILVLLLAINSTYIIYQQSISIKCDKKIYNQSEKVDIEIMNCSKVKQYFFVALSSKTDTGWASIISNIDNLRRKEIFSLDELRPGQKAKKSLLIENIPRKYFEGDSKFFRLEVLYSNTRKTFDNKFSEKYFEFEILPKKQ